MKKILLIGLILTGLSFSVSAQGFYFDIGLGVGGATTKIDEYDVGDLFKGSGVIDLGVDLGLKAGYGPFGEVPLYIVGEFGGIGHRFQDNYNYMQFNSYIIGAGLILYPVRLLQLAGTIGYSYVANVTDVPGVIFYNSKGGIAWDASLALDFGKQNHGFLLGIRYFGSTNTLEVSNAKLTSNVFTTFIKYAFRHKIERQTP
ncbi:hypothetical protein FACS189444_0240 [Spirochaetia bacterium]|nr:hypothetical protein FACS189444_0240 [Spirochaetia bacterium]